MSSNSPKSIDLLQELATLKIIKRWTFEDIRCQLNEHLPTERQIPDARSGRSQIERWMRTKRSGWVEPRGEVILAVQSVIQIYAEQIRLKTAEATSQLDRS